MEVALCLVDFQHDFLSPGGMADRRGYDISALQPARRVARRVLVRAREVGWTVVHARVGRPAASDTAGEVGPLGRPLVWGEPGHAIVDDLEPRDDELVIDKPGKGAFHGTDLDSLLGARGVTHLVLAGVTSDVCVMSTFRAAHDHGYSCLVLTDATGSFRPETHAAAMALVTTQDGLMGCTASTDELLGALR